METIDKKKELIRLYKDGCPYEEIRKKLTVNWRWVRDLLNSGIVTEEIEKARKAAQEKKKIKHLTLCWQCKKSTNMNLCSWANPDNQQPVKGWKAEAKTYQSSGYLIDSYKVIECPNFEEG